MSGLNLQTGLSGSVVDGLYPGGGTAAAPTRTAVPEGPTTIAQAAFGGGAGVSASNGVGIHATVVGAAALLLLICMWWALPR